MKKIILLLLFSALLQAQEIRTGIFIHDSGSLWGNLKKESGVDFGFEIIAGNGLFHPVAGMTLNLNGQTSKIYAGCVFEPQVNRFFFGLGAGAALHSGEIRSKTVKSLGCRILFRISLEAGVIIKRYKISILLDHISNAGTGIKNNGLDVLGVRFGWRL